MTETDKKSIPLNHTITMKNLFQFSCLTNIFEWYEFVLFSYLAVPIGYNFFDSSSKIIALLQSLALFASSYLIRPLGSLFFGYLGDKYHTRLALQLSMTIMAVPTVLTGILPTYHQVGIIAPILLITLRLIQGFSAGGELPSCAAYLFGLVHRLPNRTLLCGLVNIGGMIGVLCSSLIVFILHSMASHHTIQTWAWRVPFLLGLPLSLFIIRSRHKLMSRTIDRPKSDHAARLISDAFVKKFIKAVGIMSFLQVNFYVLFVWMPNYLEIFSGISHHIARMSNTITLIILVVMTTIFSYMGRFISYKKLIIFSSVMSLFLSYPLFTILNHATVLTVISVQIVFAIINAPLQGNYLFALCNMFKTSHLNRGLSLSYTLPTALFGGTAPFICSYFAYNWGLVTFPGVYLAVFSLAALLAVCLL